jgi:acetylornithine deacetylase
MEKAVADAAALDPWLAEHPPRVEWWGGQYEPAAIPVDHPVVGALAGALVDAGGPPARILGVPYGSDLGLLVREAGTPAVLFGPGDLRRAHAADESVEVSELVSCARALALTALRFCGTV